MGKDHQSKVHPEWEMSNVHFVRKLDSGKTTAQNGEQGMTREGEIEEGR